MKNLIKIGVSCLILSATSATVLLANDPMTKNLRTLQGEAFDMAFISQMIEHHKQGIKMAQLALQQAQSSAVKQFAEKTAQMQQKDISELTGMLGGKTPHDGNTHGTGGSSASSNASSHNMSANEHQQHEQMKQETMSKLQSAQGAEFDRVFVTEMLKHHEMGKEMAQLAQKQGAREDVRAFATKTVKQQEKESQELKGLKKQS